MQIDSEILCFLFTCLTLFSVYAYFYLVESGPKVVVEKRAEYKVPAIQSANNELVPYGSTFGHFVGETPIEEYWNEIDTPETQSRIRDCQYTLKPWKHCNLLEVFKIHRKIQVAQVAEFDKLVKNGTDNIEESARIALSTHLSRINKSLNSMKHQLTYFHDNYDSTPLTRRIAGQLLMFEVGLAILKKEYDDEYAKY